MKRFLLKYWWLFPILLGGMMVLLILMFTLFPPTILETIVGIILILDLIGLISSWLVLLINEKNTQGLISVALSFVLVFVLWYPLVLSASNDGFGKKHPIPEGLEYNIPLLSDTVIIDSLDTSTFLQVKSGGTGFYYYDFYYNALPSGDIFLRCYEVTENIPLSQQSILEETSVHVDQTFSFSKLVDKKIITIFEGDIGDFYAARFEVWHRDATTGNEKKLVEKIYRVQGYSR